MKVWLRAVAVFAALCLTLTTSPATAAGSRPDRVGDFKQKVLKVRIDKAGGADRWRTVTPRTKVFLVDKAGNRRRADVDELVRGARVIGKRIVDGRVRSIALRERPATGSADCSFDSTEDDDDKVTEGDSFSCSNDYDDGTVDTDSDCSYDSSTDGVANDWSMDTSWDCSYSEYADGDADGLDWDCSFSASADRYSDVDGGDADADLDFDCSWSGAGTDSALWQCRFMPGVLGFKCVSRQLQQEFEYTIDPTDMAFEGGFDYQRDVIDEDTNVDDGVGCSGNAADGYDCSVDGEYGAGDCFVDWSFDRSRAAEDGDVSGSLSYSCSWDR